MDDKNKERSKISWITMKRPKRSKINMALEPENKPLIDVFTMQQNTAKLSWASKHDLEVKIKQWESNESVLIKGKIPRLKAADNLVHIKTDQGLKRIEYDDIIYVFIDAD